MAWPGDSFASCACAITHSRQNAWSSHRSLPVSIILLLKPKGEFRARSVHRSNFFWVPMAPNSRRFRATRGGGHVTGHLGVRLGGRAPGDPDLQFSTVNAIAASDAPIQSA